MTALRRNFSLSAAIAVAALLAAGCAKGPSKVALPGEAGEATASAAALAKRIELHRQGTAHVRALAWVLVGDAEEERQTDAALVIERPDRVRVDAMDALADVWASAGSDGATMWLHLPARARLYAGKASIKNLHRIAKFDFGVPELVDILTGSPPLEGDESILQVGRGKDAHYIARRSRLKIWTDGKGRVVKAARFTEGGSEIECAVAFGDHRDAGGIPFPHRIEATFPSRGARILVIYKGVELGTPLEAAAFLPPRAGRAGRVHSLDRP